MKTAPKVVIILGAVAVAVVAVVVVVRPLLSQRDGIHYVTRPVGYADITATVSETGTVNPVNTVSVGSEVSGTIQTLGADFNSRVKKDQVLATLDPTDYQAAVDSSSANLRLAQANLNSANVNVGKMKALLDMATLTQQRDEPLVKQGLINQNQMDTDNTAAITATQDHLAAQASVQVAEAQVAVAQGQLDQARFNLSKTVIRSPMDGIVMARNVSVGQTVAASLQTPTIFSIASNLTDMQVDTSVDEADAGSVKQGAAAQFTVTAYPNETFAGTVIQVRINPTVTQNVVTYDAVVAVHDSTGRLLPGMTAQVTIDVGKRTHVPSVPIAGVLYRPLATAGASGGGGFAPGAGGFQSSGAAPGAQAVAGAPGSQVTVWVLQDGRPVSRRVVIGLSDSTSVEIASGPLQPGDPIIVAQRRGAAGRTQAGGAGGGPNGGSSTGGGSTPASFSTGSGASGAASNSGSARTGAVAARVQTP
jgi:HlyD family secretion protein